MKVAAFLILLCIAASASFAAPPVATSEPADALPEAVRASVTKHLPDGKIVSFEHHVEDRRHLYFVDVKRATGDAVTLLASGRGQYLGLVEEDEDGDDSGDVFIDLDTAPGGVKDAVAKYFGNAEVDSLFMEVEAERFIYCAEQTTGNTTRWASFALQGALVSEETEVPLDQLPAAVKDAVTKAHPVAKMDSASLVKEKEPAKTYYVVDIANSKGVKLELTVATEGTIQSSDPIDAADAAPEPAPTEPPPVKKPQRRPRG